MLTLKAVQSTWKTKSKFKGSMHSEFSSAFRKQHSPVPPTHSAYGGNFYVAHRRPFTALTLGASTGVGREQMDLSPIWVCNVFMKEKRELNQNILLSKPHPWGRKITYLLNVRGTELMTKFLGRKNDSLFGGRSSMQRSPTCECWGSACVPGHEEVSEIPQKCS